MKLNRIITMCAVAATLAIGTTSLLAQDNGGNQGWQRGQRGNFDPARMQQFIMEHYQKDLGFTNDADWNAVKPLVQKVMDAQMAERSGQMRGMFGGRHNRGGNNNDQADNHRPRGGMFGQPSPEADALQKAIDSNAPTAQIKDLLTKYQAAQKVKQTNLETAQSNLRAVLTIKQEAEATLIGLLN